MSRITVVLNVWLCLLVAVGVWLGLAVASHPKLETFKLLNILGLTLDLLGLVILSEFVVTSDQWKSFVVKWVALGANRHPSSRSGWRRVCVRGTILVESVWILHVALCLLPCTTLVARSYCFLPRQVG